MLNKNKKLLIILLATIIYIIFYKLGIGCPIKNITGISCAGCGMTRAYKALLNLDFRSAFYFHPLFWTIPLIIIVFLFSEQIPNKIIIIFCIIISFLFIYIYIIRILNI